MHTTRTPKKTETLELRLPFETKQAFMARCAAAGVTASEALRGFIAEFVEAGAPRTRRPMAARLRTGVVAGAILAAGAMALPSLASAGASAGFARLDADHDGAVSSAEFAAAARLKVSLEAGPLATLSAADLSPGLRALILTEQFDRMDADRNGRVVPAEFRRFRETADRR